MTHTIVLAGGGTAGHVNPLLATATCLRERGWDVRILGTREGLEADLVPAAGFEFHEIERVPLPRRPTPALLTVPQRLRHAIAQSRNVITGADGLLGFGGYVSTPAYFAARSEHIPIAIHEQNARPGLANRLGARWAALVALTFGSTPLAARQGRTEVVGLPLRPQIARLAHLRTTDEGARTARVEGAQRFGLDPDLTTLVITGGSLGALHINTVMASIASELPEGCQVLHLTGKGKDDAVRASIDEAGVAHRWHVVDYTTDMHDALAVADLVVCRSGAGTVAELSALGLPAVYVPLPIGNGEQRLNAHDHIAAGGAELINDAHFTVERARTDVMGILTDQERLSRMRSASAHGSSANAAERLTDLVEEMCR